MASKTRVLAPAYQGKEFIGRHTLEVINVNARVGRNGVERISDYFRDMESFNADSDSEESDSCEKSNSSQNNINGSMKKCTKSTRSRRKFPVEKSLQPSPDSAVCSAEDMPYNVENVAHHNEETRNKILSNNSKGSTKSSQVQEKSSRGKPEDSPINQENVPKNTITSSSKPVSSSCKQNLSPVKSAHAHEKRKSSPSPVLVLSTPKRSSNHPPASVNASEVDIPSSTEDNVNTKSPRKRLRFSLTNTSLFPDNKLHDERSSHIRITAVEVDDVIQSNDTFLTLKKKTNRASRATPANVSTIRKACSRSKIPIPKSKSKNILKKCAPRKPLTEVRGTSNVLEKQTTEGDLEDDCEKNMDADYFREAGTAKSLKSRKHASEISYEENGPQPAAAHSIRLTEKSSRKTNSRLVNKLRSAKEEKNVESSRNAKRKAKRSAEKRVNDSNLKGNTRSTKAIETFEVSETSKTPLEKDDKIGHRSWNESIEDDLEIPIHNLDVNSPEKNTKVVRAPRREKKKKEKKNELSASNSSGKTAHKSSKDSIEGDSETASHNSVSSDDMDASSSVVRKGKVPKKRSETLDIEESTVTKTKHNGEKLVAKLLESVTAENAEEDKILGPRRSKRNRVPPLQFWKNDRIEYERRKSGFIVKDVILNPTPEISRRKRRANYAPKHHSKKAKRNDMKSSEDESTDWSDVEIPNGLCKVNDPMGTVIDPNTMQEVQMCVYHPGEKLHLKSPEKGNKQLVFKKHLNTEDFGVGELTLGPSAEKGRQHVRRDVMIFYVLSGKVMVTIHNDSFVAVKGSTFFVPQGNTYNLKNLHRRMNARLTFTQIKNKIV
ncbi:centromere protein C-like isoform X2 [Xenia sp. Carnegie-2017]|uniref:centromere protein C-like isoform X2 n=1 Tax=Xenia sp. Carnegie-2017 TaxID=2897299 RepID=UPI001F03EE36|nr:centromere protein C-like isoform X2 [Xenia sp. Carnegie-2017]